MKDILQFCKYFLCDERFFHVHESILDVYAITPEHHPRNHNRYWLFSGPLCKKWRVRFIWQCL